MPLTSSALRSDVSAEQLKCPGINTIFNIRVRTAERSPPVTRGHRKEIKPMIYRGMSCRGSWRTGDAARLKTSGKPMARRKAAAILEED